MPPKSFHLSPEIHDYLVAHAEPLDDVQRWLIDETSSLGPISGMQVAPEQGQLLTMIVRLLTPSFVVEVGTFTGYSSLCMARGLPEGGRLLCCDVSEEWTEVAREAWRRGGVEDRIELRIAPALETLRALPAEPSIDLAFIDADKPGYLGYFEELVTRLVPNGLILVDNVLWHGAIVDPDAQDENTTALRTFNDHVTADARVEAVMLPISDGLTFLRKR